MQNQIDKVITVLNLILELVNGRGGGRKFKAS